MTYDMFIIVSLVSILGAVGLLAWMIDSGVSEKFQTVFKYSLFGLMAGIMGLFFMIDDDSDFNYADWKPSQKDNVSKKGGGMNLGGGPGGGGKMVLEDNGAGEAVELEIAESGAGGSGMPSLGEDELLEEMEEEAPPPEEELIVADSDCAECPEVVRIKPGVALLGNPVQTISGGARSGPASRFPMIRPFDIGQYEVTVGQFQAFVDETGYQPSNSCRIGASVQLGRSFRNPGYEPDPSHPAVCVSWMDAVKYTAWLSRKTGKPYRLPTEVEWEFAARAGRTDRFQTGPAMKPEAANFRTKNIDRKPGLMPVGSFPANANGMHDVHGNVWEMTYDCASPKYLPEGRPTEDAKANCTKRIVKGGAWYSPVNQVGFSMRAAVGTDFANNGIGFRIVREVPRKGPGEQRRRREDGTPSVMSGGEGLSDAEIGAAWERHGERLERMRDMSKKFLKIMGKEVPDTNAPPI